MKRSITKVLLCESSRRWAILLRRFFPRVVVQELPSITLLRSALLEQPEALVLWGVNQNNIRDCWTPLLEWQVAHPRVVWCVLLESELAYLAPLFYQSNVPFVVTDVSQLSHVVRAARIHAQRQRKPSLSWEDELKARLPWGRND